MRWILSEFVSRTRMPSATPHRIWPDRRVDASAKDMKKEINEMMAWQRVNREMCDEYVTVECKQWWKRHQLKKYVSTFRSKLVKCGRVSEMHEANNSIKCDDRVMHSTRIANYSHKRHTVSGIECEREHIASERIPSGTWNPYCMLRKRYKRMFSSFCFHPLTYTHTCIEHTRHFAWRNKTKRLTEHTGCERSEGTTDGCRCMCLCHTKRIVFR